MNPSGPGHREIEQDEVGRLLAEALDGGQPVVGGDDLVALGPDERGDRPDHRRVVVDDEDAERAGGDHQDLTLARPAAAGRATTNRAPVGSAGSTHSRAPIDSPSRLAAYSPIPEPARGVRLAPGVRLEDPLAPLLRDARSLVGDADPDEALDEGVVDRDRRLGRRVLHRVLDQVLEDLAEPRRVGQGVVAEAGPDVEVVLADDRPDRGDDLGDRAPRRRSG